MCQRLCKHGGLCILHDHIRQCTACSRGKSFFNLSMSQNHSPSVHFFFFISHLRYALQWAQEGSDRWAGPTEAPISSLSVIMEFHFHCYTVTTHCPIDPGVQQMYACLFLCKQECLCGLTCSASKATLACKQPGISSPLIESPVLRQSFVVSVLVPASSSSFSVSILIIGPMFSSGCGTITRCRSCRASIRYPVELAGVCAIMAILLSRAIFCFFVVIPKWVESQHDVVISGLFFSAMVASRLQVYLIQVQVSSVFFGPWALKLIVYTHCGLVVVLHSQCF